MNRFLKGYQNQNNLVGWAIFVFALVIYAMTMEQTASLWDCGEFIAGAYKLEVVHAPGAPLHALLGKIFSLLSFGDVTKVALWVNFLSAASTAFAVLFCFWTTTFFARQYLGLAGDDLSTSDKLKVFGAGIVAALSCTFLDSLWFSAVEGEVYALAMFFMTIIIWGATRWYRAEGPLADRWLIFIAFMVGLSMGAHLLSMLAIPFVGMMVYARHNEFSWQSFLIAVAVSFGVLVFVLQGIFTGIVNIFAQFDYLFVNGFGLGKGMGVWFAVIALFSALILFLLSFHDAQKSKVFRQVAAFLVVALMLGSVLNGQEDGGLGGRALRFFFMSAMAFAILRADNFAALAYRATLGIMFLIIGYSSYTMVPIRANAQVPINMNKPTDAFTMHYYLNREQFGKRPILEGPDYNVTDFDVMGQEEIGGYYAYNPEIKTYEKTQTKREYQYKEEAKHFFPRLGFTKFNQLDARKRQAYRSWLSPSYNVINLQNGQVVQSFGPEELNQATAKAQESQYYAVKDNITLGDNFKFFLQYQVGYMYMRYFLWNFAGRTNDLQGTYANEHGRWQSGIPFLDNLGMWNGNHNWTNTDLPSHRANNKANNTFYLIPFILGIIGLVYSYRKNQVLAIAISAMFLITGLVFIIYINQPPVEPRERDYVLVGSLFAFCIWMGLAVLQLIEWLSRGAKKVTWEPMLAIFIGLLAPALMGSQGYDDHDRSGRTTTIDFASNYLKSLEKDAIIFTFGDNDTYPLWYAQEVEGVRPDVRIINLSLLMQDTYYDNLRRKMNESAPLNVSLTMNDMHSEQLSRSLRLPASNPNSFFGKLKNFGRSANGGLLFPIDSAIDTTIWGDYAPYYDLISDTMRVQLSNSNDPTSYILSDLIAGNINDRPIYFAITVPRDYYSDYQRNLSLEGLAYRITPFEFASANTIPNPDLLFDNLMNKFAFGGLKQNPDILLDENVHRQFITLVNIYTMAIETLSAKNPEKAKELATSFMRELPIEALGGYSNISYFSVPRMLYGIEMNKEADQVMAFLTKYADEELGYLSTIVKDDDTEKIITNRYTNDLLGYMNQTLGFALEENTGNNGVATLSIDSAAESAVNAMFTVLTSHVTASELVQQEDGNLTYSKLGVALGDTSLMNAMQSAREAEKLSLEEELKPYNDALEGFNDQLQNALANARSEEESAQIQTQFSQYYQQISQQMSPMQSKVNAINQFEATYSAPPAVSLMDTIPAEAYTTGQVIESPMTLEIPQP